jgi:hypothetical protein
LSARLHAARRRSVRGRCRLARAEVERARQQRAQRERPVRRRVQRDAHQRRVAHLRATGAGVSRGSFTAALGVPAQATPERPAGAAAPVARGLDARTLLASRSRAGMSALTKSRKGRRRARTRRLYERSEASGMACGEAELPCRLSVALPPLAAVRMLLPAVAPPPPSTPPPLPGAPAPPPKPSSSAAACGAYSAEVRRRCAAHW